MIVQAPLKISMIIISDYIGIKSDYNLIYIMCKCKLYALIYNTYRVYMFDTFHLQLLLIYVQHYTSFHPREPRRIEIGFNFLPARNNVSKGGSCELVVFEGESNAQIAGLKTGTSNEDQVIRNNHR